MRRRRRPIDWPKLKTAARKSAAIKGLLTRTPGATSTVLQRHFSGITREGLVTHCWRYGPKLPRGKGRPKKRLPRTRKR